MEIEKSKPNGFDVATWMISAAALWLVLRLRLLPVLLSGLLVYELVHSVAPLLRISKLSDSRARLVVVTLLSSIIIASLAMLCWWTIHFIRNETTSLSTLLQRMADIINEARNKLPRWLGEYLPDDVVGLRKWIVEWLRAHASDLPSAGKDAGRVVAHLLAGMVLGAIIALRETKPTTECPRPLAFALTERVTRLDESFRAVVFAQIRISALNTLFTWVYLGVALPLLGIHLPLVKTMLLITFVAGLLPIIGNLISNTIIIVVSLSYSLSVSAASLLFLILIHKMEYFLNARIVGHRIRSEVWELLLAMLIFESAFGVSGVIAAPIYYAYLKRELTDRRLV